MAHCTVRLREAQEPGNDGLSSKYRLCMTTPKNKQNTKFNFDPRNAWASFRRFLEVKIGFYTNWHGQPSGRAGIARGAGATSGKLAG